MPSSDVVIIGAGIAGLAQAWSAAERGRRVTVCERDPQAWSASVRNFGMVWPIGQPLGPMHDLALVGRQRWLCLAEQTGVWAEPCGSLFLAHHEDEWGVLQEMHALATGRDMKFELLTPAETLRRSPYANPQGLRGSLFSPWEVRVNPRTAIPALTRFLAECHGVQFHFNTTITRVATGEVHAADGRIFQCERSVVCNGADVMTLFPREFARPELRPCKLQMLKTAAQPAGFRLGPHLAGGLTLRHYETFAGCPSLVALKQRVAAECPALDQYGIHVMASQDESGALILGDSHEYDANVRPFNKSEIDELILRELGKILLAPNGTIAERWHGVYLKTMGAALFTAEPLPGVHLFSGHGGNGMTLCFAWAEQAWKNWA